MKLLQKNNQYFESIDQQYYYDKDDLGARFNDDKFTVKLWHPLAKEVHLYIYKNQEQDELITTYKMNKNTPIFEVEIPKEYESFAYRYFITQQDGTQNFALDPYSFSMSPFNWEGKEDKVGKSVFVNLNSQKIKFKNDFWKPKTNNSVDPIIYELNIRDFTSLKSEDKKHRKGTFKSALEFGVIDHIKDLDFNYVQLLPVHECYTYNSTKLDLIFKHQAQKWTTNYNWGYDPHNYFSVNGWYSENPADGYSRINDFLEFVNQAHKKDLGVIVDVVYNHLMTNNILNNVFPGYYFRDDAKTTPVSYPPLASNRKMVRKLIIDSLKFYAQYYKVDGFRFDLSCFIDKTTLEDLSIELRKINPKIVLHGEAWRWSDLDYSDSWIKGETTNDYSFAYFNDTLRDSISKCEFNKSTKGLIIGNDQNLLEKYISSVVGNLKDYDFKNIKHANNSYDLFCSDIKMNLAFNACHDYFTLFDKIITSDVQMSFEEVLNRYRQALIMTLAVQGRKLYLAGTELLQSKPNDKSGMDDGRAEKMINDFLNLNPDDFSVLPNTYKTSDYVNGIKWQNLELQNVKEHIYEFVKATNKFRNQTKYFRFDNNQDIINNIHFSLCDYEKGILIYQIKDKKTLEVIHNFSDHDFEYNIQKDNVLFNSRINDHSVNTVKAHTSLIIEK
ncbi:alpha-amylase family glycosyl hydrolase [Mycoplasmopsis ciconiae]|uniref:Alpha-amylase family glycosyl hydrolase n=1 Tax=Mycoplasmopsis ciconiae TaxID=561067 RepID=A0ABU7MLA4_9BACT|nr:alpha-amylase family glycosyl hydrolase [Mycoplasmopsis ciconiae]